MNLPTTIEELIKQKVASGLYDSPGAVLDRAFAALAIVEQEDAEIRRKIAIGIEQARRGDGGG